ncbi:MAG: Hpt domain-containing protein, partial [Curvibacter sp.]
MTEGYQEGGGAGDAFDLSQFYQIFFEEASENLDKMEQMLLNLNLETADDEELNGIFRCAHSVKGGAATFGFGDVAELTHEMESLLDKLRRHELQPNSMMVDVLLESADISRMLLARHQAGDSSDPPSTADLVRRISELAAGSMPAAAVALAPAPVAVKPAAPPAALAAQPKGERLLEIRFGPMEKPELVDGIKDLFRDIAGLGQASEVACDTPNVRVFKVSTSSSDSDLLDLFVFHVAREQVTIKAAAAAATPKASQSDSFGFFDDAPGAPGGAAPAAVSPPVTLEIPDITPDTAQPVAKATKAAPAAQVTAQPEAATIRVAISKVDQLINLVGELVITQAMLAQNSRALDPAANQQLMAGLADLDRNTRDLQESVMSIRMIPMSVVFSRFPRMLRDLANKLGKKVEFVTQGEATELDKGL